MHQKELIEELSLRASVPLTAAQAVFDALLAMEREGLLGESLLAASAAAWRPSDPRDRRAVDALIASARQHPLGVDFLLRGFLGAVAAEFGTHAFTVEEARLRLKSEGSVSRRDEVLA